MVMLITTVKRHLAGLQILLIVLLASACAPDRTAELDDIREATFRYQFRINASGLQQRARVFFLALRDTKNRQRLDPTEDFLRRFKDHHPRVGPVSAARSSSTDGVIDKTTGERGLIFIVGEIHWLAADRVDVKGGYFEAGESSSGNTYHLRKKAGKWEVESDTMHWISLNRSWPAAHPLISCNRSNETSAPSVNLPNFLDGIGALVAVRVH